MQNTILEDPIKIVGIQTVPGKELEVKSNLEKACKDSQNIDSYLFYKGVGSFDIILIYATKDFGPHLRTAGPINGILKTNLFLCYSFLNNKLESFFDNIEKKIFIALSFVKINPGLKSSFPKIDKLLREVIAKDNDKLLLLGTLGWNELIIIKSTNNLDKIFKHFQVAESISLVAQDAKFSVIHKTLSLVGINYNSLPKRNTIEKGYDSIKSFLENNTSFKKEIRSSLEEKNFPNIEVTAKNIYHKKIINILEEKGFLVSNIAGKSDLLATIKDDNMTWAIFLGSIIYLRHEHSEEIISTCTKLLYADSTSSNEIRDIKLNVKPNKFNYKHLELMFGKPSASYLANLFYTLNSQIQNPLGGNSFLSMIKYPKYIYTIGEISEEMTSKQGNHSLSMSIERFALNSGHAIQRGAELRSYGTYETIEESAGSFSELKGGCQLSLTAMEYIPYYILDRIGMEWMGFITVSGARKVSSFNEIINVTPDTIWSPQLWWTMYHEIAHILINREKNILNNLVVEECLLSSDLSPSILSRYYIEFGAEIIGFEMGMFDNYDLYFNLLWRYLININKYYKIDWAYYAIRSFFVELFIGCFRFKNTTNKYSKKDFKDMDYLYGCFLAHLERIEEVINYEIDNKHFIVAKNLKLFTEVYPFCEYLSSQIVKMKIKPKRKYLEEKNTKDVVSSLKEAKIWWGRITCPEAILYHLFREGDIKFNTGIATIISFWNQRMITYRENYYVY